MATAGIGEVSSPYLSAQSSVRALLPRHCISSSSQCSQLVTTTLAIVLEGFFFFYFFIVLMETCKPRYLHVKYRGQAWIREQASSTKLSCELGSFNAYGKFWRSWIHKDWEQENQGGSNMVQRTKAGDDNDKIISVFPNNDLLSPHFWNMNYWSL